MTVECPVMACRDFPGPTWMGMDADARMRTWVDHWAYFIAYVEPPNLIEWVEGPAERTEYDEAARRVRLFIEGVALVPDIVGYPI
jgi:hypothetical protein